MINVLFLGLQILDDTNLHIYPKDVADVGLLKDEDTSTCISANAGKYIGTLQVYIYILTV